MAKMKTVTQATVYFNDIMEQAEVFDISDPSSDVFENVGGYRIVDDDTDTTYFPYHAVRKIVVDREDVNL